ncbi:MAG TPA: DoxX family membrane protein [Roseiflexaceae bacterium]|nr:DoxX family membrane protein [Roseiflexaceae bacterium]HMP40793.1 DoxX family membrane protein [Roseiflexaceae bacterium]
MINRFWPNAYEQADQFITNALARHSLTLLRWSMGIIFIWFGALKLLPGMSPAESLIRASVPLVPMEIFIPLLAAWEILIGIGFVANKYMRFTILILLAQMIGTALPIVVRPDLVFTIAPFGLTLEGQYIIKNFVLVSAALVIGATVRGGGLVTNHAGR